MPVHGVLAEHERRGDLTVREAGRDEAQHLGLAAGQRRVAVRLGWDGVVEEPRERALNLALVVDVRQMRVPARARRSGRSGAVTRARDRG